MEEHKEGLQQYKDSPDAEWDKVCMDVSSDPNDGCETSYLLVSFTDFKSLIVGYNR